MRGLRIAAIICVTVFLVVALLTVYLFRTAEVRITSVSAQGIAANCDEAYFNELKNSIENGTHIGTLLHKPEAWREPDDYVFIDYTLNIRNDCLVPLDMLEVQVVPLSEDILQVGDYQVHALDAKSSGDLTVRILTTRETHSIRDLILTYYVWGIAFTARATCGAAPTAKD